MGIFSYLQDIYQLDTLDTRFTNPSNTPYKPSNNAQVYPAESKESRNVASDITVKLDINGQPLAQPSKWGTTEFYFYYLCFLTIVPYMFWVPYDVSRPSDPNYQKYEHLLSPGWVPGRKIDISDAQYSTFRENIPYTVLLLIFQPLLRRAYQNLRPISVGSTALNRRSDGSVYSNSSIAYRDSRLNQRASFDCGFALLFIGVLHGFSSLKVLLILYINFCIAKKLPRKYVPAATWIFNIGTLFANELCDGYKYTKVFQFVLSGQESVDKDSILHTWGSWLDSYGGIMSRWEILFNLTVLRLISFNMDYYWSLDRRAGSPVEKKQLDQTNLSERDRIRVPANEKDYSFRNYLAFALYAPLYIAGPIFTFNDYISQLKYQPKTIELSRTVKYGIRFFLTLLCMELVLHFDYCIAISKANPNWADYSPIQLSLLSYFNLHILWLKLLIPWRFFRLWALIDGIDPPENMIRCVSDTFSTVSFWRGWHRSYNRWLIRYLYIPLGGSRVSGRFGTFRAVFNYVVIFTFVALWHDIQLNLLIWGWLVVLFMLPEVIAGYLFPRKRWINNLTGYRILCGVGAVGNLMSMMIANLVGFAVGVEGLKMIVAGIFKDHWGIAFIVTVTGVLFVGIQVMFEVRESEMRKGIYMTC